MQHHCSCLRIRVTTCAAGLEWFCRVFLCYSGYHLGYITFVYESTTWLEREVYKQLGPKKPVTAKEHTHCHVGINSWSKELH